MTHAAGNANALAAGDVQSIFLSTDGRYCAFEYALVVSGWDSFTGTYAANSEAAYLYDRQTDTMKLITKRNNDAAPSTQVLNPTVQAISGDGRYVYFLHGDIDFGTATTDSNGFSDLYRYDRDGGSTRLSRLFHDVHALAPNAVVTLPIYSVNGRYLVFLGQASNLVTGDTNGRNDVFRLDTQTSTLVRVNVNADGSEWTTTNNGSFAVSAPQVDNNGDVVFSSNATGLGFTDTNATTDLFRATFAEVDTTAPTVASVTRLTPSNQATNASAVTFRVTYSEPVTNVTGASFAVQGVNGGTVAGTIAVSGTDNTDTRDVTVTITGGSGEFTLKIVN
jgi:hypothetical protein